MSEAIGDICRCGHHRAFHGGHTVPVGDPPDTHCAARCGCRSFVLADSKTKPFQYQGGDTRRGGGAGPREEGADPGNQLAVAQTEFHRLRELFRRIRPEIHNLTVSGWDNLKLIEAILRNRFPEAPEVPGADRG